MKKIAVLLIVIACSFTAKAQDFGQIIAGSLPDANKYASAYMRPFAEGEIYNLARGWYSTARTHKLLGFDISINGQFAIVPTEKQSFTFNNADYSTFKLSGAASSATLPTLMGGTSSQVINVNTTVNGQPVSTSFTAPKGIGDDMKKNVSFIPVSAPLPVAQIGIGLFKHTDLKVRYFPKTNFSDMEIGVFGVGIQHEFSNYLPFIKKVPFLHLSALAAFSSIDANYKPKFDPGSSVQSPNAVAGYKISAFTLQGIASVKFAILELYTSIGYSTGKSTIDLKGDYTITYNTGFPPPNDKATATQKDPISLSYNAGGVSNTWGARLNITVLKIYVDYTFAKYNGAGAGIALAFR
ncbi:MAG: hypothetical protein K2Q21_00915 [Chitinophagaceae bacterium]|nr:hypothetical protein [Chitinophagaceae bacterium]